MLGKFYDVFGLLVSTKQVVYKTINELKNLVFSNQQINFFEHKTFIVF